MSILGKRAPGLSRQKKSQATNEIPDDLVEVARVVGAHGIRGWVKIQPFSVDSTVLGSVKQWWVGARVSTLDQERAESARQTSDSQSKPEASTLRKVDVLWARAHGANWLAAIDGLADRDEALALKGHSVWVSRQDFPQLEEDEYYWVDLIGCEVLTVESGEPERLGIVESVEDNPAHPLLAVLCQKKNEDGEWVALLNARKKPVSSLIPFVAAHVKQVDLDNKRIVVDWPAEF